jgi:hypothetical protein
MQKNTRDGHDLQAELVWRGSTYDAMRDLRDQEQNLAPNLTRVSGQLLSVRRTTRARRVLDFTCGVSML